jgi:hypothetical protein
MVRLYKMLWDLSLLIFHDIFTRLSLSLTRARVQPRLRMFNFIATRPRDHLSSLRRGI